MKLYVFLFISQSYYTIQVMKPVLITCTEKILG